MNCAAAQDNIYADWAKGKYVSRCPRCKARFENEGECDQVKCPRCEFHHCFICGLEIGTLIHNA